jgi:O-antigen ligase
VTDARERLFPAASVQRVAVVAGVAVSGNLVLVGLLSRHVALGVAFGALPLVVLAFLGLMRHRWVLAALALILPVTISQFSTQFAFAGHHFFASDIVLLLTISTWLVARLTATRDHDQRLRWPATPVLGWPLVPLGVVLVTATIRGHTAYGTSLLNQPLRLVLFAAMGAAFAGVRPEQFYRVMVKAVYAVVIWQVLGGVYFLARHTVTTGTFYLSTGGQRSLSGTTAAYMASALFLALLNLQVERDAKRRLLHISIALLALVAIILAFNRTTFIGIALIVPVLVFRRETFRALVSLAPLFAPVVALGLIALVSVKPSLVTTFTHRISVHPHNDLSVEWRQRAWSAVAAQVRESPLVGVGFGRISYFYLPNSPGGPPVQQVVTQDAHEDYLWLLAGGGVLLLASYIGVIGTYLYDMRRRLKSAVEPYERVLVRWSLATVALLLFASFTSPVIVVSQTLLTLWTMLLLPAIVPLRRVRSSSTTFARTDRPDGFPRRAAYAGGRE